MRCFILFFSFFYVCCVSAAQPVFYCSKQKEGYALTARGFTVREPYILYVQRLNQNPYKLCTCVAKDNGELNYGTEGEGLDVSAIGVEPTDYVPGEPLEFILVSKKDHRQFKTKIIPNPLETTDSEGRKVSLELIDRKKKHYLACLTHLKPEEDLIALTGSGSEQMRRHVKANAKGHAFIMLTPAASQTTGKAHLEVMAVASNSKMTLDY